MLRTGLLAETNQPCSLARTLLELTREPDLKERLCAAAREEWRQRFTLQQYQQRICDEVERAFARGFSNVERRCLKN